MTDHTGFEADLEVLKGIADQTMPQVAQTISTVSSPVSSLLISAGVFASGQGGSAMTAQYNDVLTELSTALTSFADSVAVAAGRLHGIAENILAYSELVNSSRYARARRSTASPDPSPSTQIACAQVS